MFWLRPFKGISPMWSHSIILPIKMQWLLGECYALLVGCLLVSTTSVGARATVFRGPWVSFGIWWPKPEVFVSSGRYVSFCWLSVAIVYTLSFLDRMPLGSRLSAVLHGRRLPREHSPSVHSSHWATPRLGGRSPEETTSHRWIYVRP